MISTRRPLDSSRPRRSDAFSANFGEDGDEHDSVVNANRPATNVANTRGIDMRAIFAKSGAIASKSSSTEALTGNVLGRDPAVALGHPHVALRACISPAHVNDLR